MAGTMDLRQLLLAIARADRRAVLDLLDATPPLATARLARPDEFFLAERLAQVYEGDTALHAAGFNYHADLARDLIARGADVRASNRRGAEPLHAAVIGVPDAPSPARQREVIRYLIEAGADPNAAAAGGVTPLHRAVRNTARRCRSPPPERPRLDRVRPRPMDNWARRLGLVGCKSRAANHHRIAPDHDIFLIDRKGTIPSDACTPLRAVRIALDRSAASTGEVDASELAARLFPSCTVAATSCRPAIRTERRPNKRLTCLETQSRRQNDDFGDATTDGTTTISTESDGRSSDRQMGVRVTTEVPGEDARVH